MREANPEASLEVDLLVNLQVDQKSSTMKHLPDDRFLRQRLEMDSMREANQEDSLKVDLLVNLQVDQKSITMQDPLDDRFLRQSLTSIELTKQKKTGSQPSISP